VLVCDREAEGIKISDFDKKKTAIVSSDSDVIGFNNHGRLITILNTTLDDGRVELVNLSSLPAKLFGNIKSVDAEMLLKVVFTLTGNDFVGRIKGVGLKTALEGISTVVKSMNLADVGGSNLVEMIGRNYFLWLLSGKNIFIHPKERLKFINRWKVVYEYYLDSRDSFAVQPVSVCLELIWILKLLLIRTI
jgi:5'-3' exonuclease